MGRESKKINVDICDEVYYPVVSFVRAEKVEVKIIKTEQSEPVALSETIKQMGEPVSKRRRLRAWWSKVQTVLVVMVVVCAVVLAGMKLSGFRTFTVMSGSMEPEYPVGALIYVRPVDYKSLKVGDVISFVANDDKTIVTHRIYNIEIDEKDSNIWRFQTKGDVNNAPDTNLVHYKNVLGTPIITIPHIGYFVHNIQRPPGIYITLVVGTLLLAWTFLPGTLEGRRKTARKSVA